MIRSILGLGAILTLAGAAQAVPRGREVPVMATVKGTCERLVIAGRDLTAQCASSLLNTSYASGRVGFYFVASGGAALTFTGMGSSQVKPDPETALQPVDGVVFGTGGRFDKAKAVGTCRYTNPYGRPATIRCTAETQGGFFAADFVTDGTPPEVAKP